ncbi:Peptidoglycan/xylan/chitin deacetylase, PgdA/CDA1 family [Daejeonella rubra]|uniref:Peptidoglycan/xylan/chitin deacetylase, PgdA/CDA1 family n=1 Tax=Daejeonella rubra TaxID=990371 RepID=A0A1G9TII1_9SPHI|nr:polysaccharide deacetylase family protein [Daejeonella rubra]SDM47358.1 Peptidoglycan/xylan/chitin deacetylase, PgdA/CDA1 family [Daejeonella rubra]
MYLTSSPFWLQWFYPTLTWHKNRKEKIIYLTFDDGPIPVVTPYVLNTLKKFNAQATFFCIGENIDKYPEIFSEIISEGHTVGNHTQSHLKGWNTRDDDYLNNVRKCSELTGSQLFRPPYGRIKKSQITAINKQFPETEIVMWDVLSGDFDQTISARTCISNVLKNTRNGSIIVFHDSIKAFGRLEQSLPIILEKLSAQGFVFRTL